MPDYWLQRHADSLAKAEQSPSSALRAVYRQLADHYWALHVAQTLKHDGAQPENRGD